jgi:dipeptidyl aminopeptidase/acylaminoacyl peptidase
VSADGSSSWSIPYSEKVRASPWWYSVEVPAWSSWSPVAPELAITNLADGDPSCVALWSDGEIHTLTCPALSPDEFPVLSWSPDGSRLVYARDTASGTTSVVLDAADGTEITRIDAAIQWNSSGSMFYALDDHLVLLDAHGQHRIEVAGPTDAHWMPDGIHLATVDADGSVSIVSSADGGKNVVWRKPADDGMPTLL